MRYVRDYLNGSNKDTGNHWVEIEVWGFRTTVYVGAHYEKDVTGNAATSYYSVGGRRIAQRRAGVVYYLHTDHLGSASLTTDASGNRVGELRYKPYGETRYIWGVMRTDRRYTGQRWEAGLGLYDYGARFYDPLLARFISADTIVPQPGNPQSLNRYAYVNNNPLKYTDPSGHWLETAWDIANIVWDIYEIRQDPGNLWNWAALVVDVGAALLPVVLAGAGMVVHGGRAAKAAVGVASRADEVVNVARLGARAEEFTKVAHIPGAGTLLKKLLSTSAPTLRGAEFELEFALKHADEIEEMGKVLEVIQGGNKEI